MIGLQRWQTLTAGLVASCALAACGGGDGPAPQSISPPAAEVGAPVLTNNISTDGLNWINFRRTQLGIPTLARNGQIDIAAQGHSDYQRANNTVSHDQIAGRQGFTGSGLRERLNAAGYIVPPSGFAIGEIISAAGSNNGHTLSEELVTAIYHRFVMFEPKFKEIGGGAATNGSSYTYFTANLAAREGYGPGIGRGNLVSWPFNGQTGVTRNFFSDYEAPDPVPDRNEVGYPISVHADIDVTLMPATFTIRPRGGADLPVKLLRRSASDQVTPWSAVAIVPLEPLRASTTYEVSFTGTTDSTPISKSWSFTTK